jgi:glycosyltransferase involved in cell wall biosynthesis
MRIAQVAPLYESVPPVLYGGTERVVSYLTEELVRQGHHVTLFASGDSVTSATLVAPCPRSLRLNDVPDQLLPHVMMVDQVYERADEFDIIHFHIDYLHYPTSRRADRPHVTTLHGRLDLPQLADLYREFDRLPLVSISDAQRQPLADARWEGTVYHGLPSDLYGFHATPGPYLAFVGRISPEKRVDRAIEIARVSGVELRIAAKVDPSDREYFESTIAPLIRQPGITYVGEIDDRDKDIFIGNALALLFPIDWPEPFGLIMIEALACGTPVIAWDCGSVPEVIDDGETGFICREVDQAVSAVRRVKELSRVHCRRVFEERYSARRMARDYVHIYERLVRLHGREKDGHGRDNSRPGSILHSRDVLTS